jgi:hypothetical protein
MIKANTDSIGFTGTRDGMNTYQKEQVRTLLLDLEPAELEVHHGDCVGADAEFHDIAASLDIKIVIHPPLDDRLRAFKESDFILEPKEYIDRNHDIVYASWLLIAAPNANKARRSGTWSTLNFAKEVFHPTYLITPSFVFHQPS